MDDKTTGANRNYIVPGLRRGLAVLGLFGRSRPTMRVAEIGRELGLPRATAFRLVYTLETEGYLLRGKDSVTYSLGPRVLTLGFDYLHSQELIEVAGPILDDLRDRVGASTHMGLLDGCDILYVYRAPSHQRLSSNRRVGSRLPAHFSSLGRAMLLDLSDEELAELYDADYDFHALTQDGPGNLDELKRCLAEERQRGYIAGSFIGDGIISVAAPVRDASGRAIAAINVSDYESLPCMADLHGALKDNVLNTAADISRYLGYSEVPRRETVARGLRVDVPEKSVRNGQG
ncbi:IclR family transcriptional regulator [Halomonas kalidii]|uniref:IclR family transcriptional regulator n=1 Tax=Halomonas kalidii TaxID=3043293 RepID=A0ABT6VTC0_9GAMM|nr:IclR family transcriptional regulator [Halomonas kalidii]MDI5936213.1 IclR family transcriptional regulator [Halomonas kalidii]